MPKNHKIYSDPYLLINYAKIFLRILCNCICCKVYIYHHNQRQLVKLSKVKQNVCCMKICINNFDFCARYQTSAPKYFFCNACAFLPNDDYKEETNYNCNYHNDFFLVFNRVYFNYIFFT